MRGSPITLLAAISALTRSGLGAGYDLGTPRSYHPARPKKKSTHKRPHKGSKAAKRASRKKA